METSSKLAIVIPAYKGEFFEQAIESIATQTNKDFTLYIGDDASPHDLEKIVKPFKKQISIVYKRFENNLGANNLIAHWNRCIDLIQDEEWIWFFSDDDLMEPTCIELFYRHIKSNPSHTLLHFNLQIIDQSNTPLYKALKFDPYFSATDFFKKRLNNEIHSCAVEYVFKRSLFEQVNRFESFDLAWASDDATWIKLSAQNGINTIDGAYVRWRQSDFNISPKSDVSTVHRKLNATINYIMWVKDFFQQHNLSDASSEIEKASYPIRVITHTKSLSLKEKFSLITYVVKSLNASKLRLRMTLFWAFLELKEAAKRLINYNERVSAELKK